MSFAQASVSVGRYRGRTRGRCAQRTAGRERRDAVGVPFARDPYGLRRFDETMPPVLTLTQDELERYDVRGRATSSIAIAWAARVSTRSGQRAVCASCWEVLPWIRRPTGP